MRVVAKLLAFCRDRWVYVALLAVGLIVGIAASFIFADQWHAESSAARDALQLVAVLVGVAAAVVGVIQTYLQHGATEANALASEQVSQQLSPPPSSGQALSEWVTLDAKITALQQRLDSAAVPVTARERSEITRAVAEGLAAVAITTKLQDLSRRVAQTLSRDRAAEALERNSVVSLARLNAAIPELTKRANLNLAIGIATTVVGVSVLTVAVFTLPAPQKPFDAWIYLAHFVPRLSLAALIELFAYFFLRLYKDNLESASFLRNEMTRVEVARAMLTTVILTGDQPAIAGVAESLATSDHKLSAQSNAARLDAQQIKAILELLEKVAAVVSPKAG